MKTVDEFKPQGDEERETEEDIRPGGEEMDAGEIAGDLETGVEEAGDQSSGKKEDAEAVRGGFDFLSGKEGE